MANVQVIQRNAHLVGDVKVEQAQGRNRPIAKAVLIAISNRRRGTGDNREEEATANLWTLWGVQAENAARYLGRSSHVNVVGHMQNNSYQKDGQQIFGFTFTVDEFDYLDTRGKTQAENSSTHGGDSAADARGRSEQKAGGQAGEATRVQGSEHGLRSKARGASTG